MASFIISTDVTTQQTLTGNEGGILTQNGSIAVLGANAIIANGNSHDLLINGTVASDGFAIFADCAILDVIVGAQGNILSTGFGLFADVSSFSRVVNNGTISARATAVALSASDTSAEHSLVNTGTISGDDIGVLIEARGIVASTIVNSGVIAGGDDEVNANFTTDAVLEVWNTGTIIGGDFSFIGSQDDGSGTSSDQVHNAGLMLGDILLNSGDDLYDGTGGQVVGTVDAGAGDDTLIGGNDTEVFLGDSGEDLIRGRGGDDEIDGGANNDILRGGAGNDEVVGGDGEDLMFGGEGADILRGGADNDVIRGGDGNDEITGGNGADKLIGGAGADTFIYTSAAQSPFGGGLDIIRDFTSGEDQIDLSDIVGPDLTFIGTAGFSGTQGEVRYVTNAKGNASVFADADGDGVADLRIFLVNVQSLDQGDFVL